MSDGRFLSGVKLLPIGNDSCPFPFDSAARAVIHTFGALDAFYGLVANGAIKRGQTFDIQRLLFPAFRTILADIGTVLIFDNDHSGIVTRRRILAVINMFGRHSTYSFPACAG